VFGVWSLQLCVLDVGFEFWVSVSGFGFLSSEFCVPVKGIEAACTRVNCCICRGVDVSEE